MKKIVIFVCVVILSFPLFGSHFLVPQVVDIRIEASVDKNYARVVVAATLTKNRDMLLGLKLWIDKKEVGIPARSYEDVFYPDLNSLEVRYDSSDKKDVYIYLEYSERNSEKVCSILFLVRDGLFISAIKESHGA